LIVEKRVNRCGPPDRVVKMCNHPNVREAVDVCKAATVWFGEDDAGWPGHVGGRLERHAIERGVSGADVADSFVLDRVAGAVVEQRLDKRSGRTSRRQSPDGHGSLESTAKRNTTGEGVLPALEDG
jgi:hypothetical protein